jgi:hypothetical protein
MVGPTNLNPSFFRTLLIFSAKGVKGGTSSSDLKVLTRVFPAVNSQIN